MQLKNHALICAVAFVIAWMTGCTGRVQPAFEGTFVQDAKSEFSMASDTLLVEKVKDRHYRIHRRTGIRLLDEQGTPGKLILEKEEWHAELDPQTGILTERSKGRRLQADGQTLTLERAVYRRVP